MTAADHDPSPATDDQVYCCVACRAEGWACPALCQRPCCGAEIAATQNEACACGHARFMHGDTTGDTGCRGCRCESWRPEPPSPLDDLCCNGEGCSRCATPSPATDGLREAVEALADEWDETADKWPYAVWHDQQKANARALREVLAAHTPPSETATEGRCCAEHDDCARPGEMVCCERCPEIATCPCGHGWHLHDAEAVPALCLSCGHADRCLSSDEDRVAEETQP